MKQDGRRDKRQPIALRVRFKSATLSDFIEKHSGDVSRGGIFVKTKKPMPVGTLLKFEFLLKSDESLINGVGRVVWTRLEESKDKEPPGMGIKFIKLDDENKSRLEQIVSGQAPKNDLEIDEPFGATEGSFPPSLQTSLTPEFEVSENLEELDLDATDEKDSKPPIAVPRAVAPPPKQRGPSVPVPAGAKGTMLGYIPIGEPPPERGGEMLTADTEELAQVPQTDAQPLGEPGPLVEASAVTSEEATRPVPTATPARGIVTPDLPILDEDSEDQALISTREHVIDEEMLRKVETGASEPERASIVPSGERESGILKDISMAIDTALTRKKKAAGPAETAGAVPSVPEAIENTDDAVYTVGESEAAIEAEPNGPLMAEDVGLPSEIPPPELGDVLDSLSEEEEESEEDDLQAHEAVVLDEKPVRSSVSPGKPVVEATRAGAEADSSTGVPVPLVVFLVILILGGGAGAAWWFLMGPGNTAAPKPNAPPVTQKAPEPIKPAPVVTPKLVAEDTPSVISSVEITTVPKDARIYVAGELQKTSTPLVLGNLPSGKEIEIRLSAFGYAPLTQKVMVEASPKKIQLKMENVRRRVVLKGSPKGASVFANGNIIGKLGNTITAEKIGPVFSYLVRKTGYEPKRGTIRRANWVEVEDGWQTEISAKLKPSGSSSKPAVAPKPVEAPAPSTPAPTPAPAAKPKPAKSTKPVAPKKKKPKDNLDDNPF